MIEKLRNQFENKEYKIQKFYTFAKMEKRDVREEKCIILYLSFTLVGSQTSDFTFKNFECFRLVEKYHWFYLYCELNNY